MFFDSQFYEYSALCYISKEYGEEICLNYKIPDFSLPLSRRIELDGLFQKMEIGVEVKSYPLNLEDIDEIVSKYEQLGLRRLAIISPKFLSRKDFKNIDFFEFIPSLETFSKEKYRDLPMEEPGLVMKELASGKHNFKFRLAKRGKNKRSRYLNQTDKLINTIPKLKAEIEKRIPNNNSIVKILWSTKRWVAPKDNFFAKRNNLYLGGPIVFDIDGQHVHGAFRYCIVRPGTNICDMCQFYAGRETKRLVNILDWAGFSNILIFSSGRAGFHVYVFDENEDKLMASSKKFMERKIKIDQQVTYSIKSEIAFPLSINGYTGMQLEQMK